MPPSVYVRCPTTMSQKLAAAVKYFCSALESKTFR